LDTKLDNKNTALHTTHQKSAERKEVGPKSPTTSVMTQDYGLERALSKEVYNPITTTEKCNLSMIATFGFLEGHARNPLELQEILPW
jgi:hypothetical protein